MISVSANVIQLSASIYRDYSKPDREKYLIRVGDKTLTAEEYGLLFFAQQAFTGYFTENQFWERLAALLALQYNFINVRASGFVDGRELREEETGLYALRSATQLAERLGEGAYRQFVNSLEHTWNLKKLFRRQWKHYTRSPLYFEKEKRWRNDVRKEFPLLVLRVLTVLSQHQLVEILDYIYRFEGKDLRGVPDLTLFRGSEIAFAEIKGPTDRIRPCQARCLEFLAEEIGLTTYLLRLEEKEPVDAAEKERFERHRSDSRRSDEKAKERLSQLIGAPVRNRSSLPPVPNSCNSERAIELIEAANSYNLKYLHWFAAKLIERVTDTEESSSLMEIFKRLSSRASDPQEWFNKCKRRYQQRIVRNKGRAKEELIVREYFQAREVEKAVPIDSEAIYRKILKELSSDLSFFRRLPSYYWGSVDRLTLLLERQKCYQECLDVFDSYYKPKQVTDVEIRKLTTPREDLAVRLEKRRRRVEQRACSPTQNRV